jgi:hypothetical protein
MEAIAHSPSFAKKAGVPQSVGKEFAKADKGHTFSKGGDMKAKKMAMGGTATGAAMDPRKAAMIAQAMKNRPRMAGPQMAAPAPQMAAPGMKKGGFVKAADGVAKKGKTKATQIKMAKGGSTKKYC